MPELKYEARPGDILVLPDESEVYGGESFQVHDDLHEQLMDDIHIPVSEVSGYTNTSEEE